MGEPLSIAANIVAVLQLSAVVIQHLKDVRHGGGDRVRLRDELRHCVPLLEMLKDRIEDDAPGEDGGLSPASMASIIASDGPLASFKRLLEDLIEKLVPKGKMARVGQTLVWPFDKKELLEKLDTMERLKSHFSLIMQNKIMYVWSLRPADVPSLSHFHGHADHSTDL